MLVLGHTFCSGGHCANPTYINTDELNKLEISKCICEDIFISSDNDLEFINSNKRWYYTTLLYALFNNNLLGGNVEFGIKNITSIRVKTRIKGTYKWNTIYEIPIEKSSDLSFERFFRYAQCKTEYEFAIVPVLNDSVEGNINISSCFSDFSGVYFAEKDSFICGHLNYEYTQSRNTDSTTVKTLGRKYPFIIANSLCNYDNGTLNVTFIRYDNVNEEYDVENAWIYRKEITDFLTNNRPKLIKNDEGKMWIVCLIGNIDESQNNHYQNVISNIQWVEIGDAHSSIDLYDNGLIDAEIVRYI